MRLLYISEWKRPSTFRTRLLSLVLKWLLYFMLIPAMLSGSVIGASLKLGSSWGEAIKNVSLVAQTTLSTYETHLDLIKLSAQIILKLEGESHSSDLDMIAYAAEVRSRTSALSAEIDKTLADYLRRQVELSKKRTIDTSNSTPSEAEIVTLEEVIGGSIIGAIIPLFMYWILSYLLTRWWLMIRDRETLSIYKDLA